MGVLELVCVYCVAKSVNICNIIALLSSIYRRISVLPRSLLGKVFRKTACDLGIDRAVLVLVWRLNRGLKIA